MCKSSSALRELPKTHDKAATVLALVEAGSGVSAALAEAGWGSGILTKYRAQYPEYDQRFRTAQERNQAQRFASREAGAQRANRGETHHLAQLTDRDVELLRRMSAEGASYRQLAKMFGIGKSHVQSLVTCRTRAPRID